MSNLVERLRARAASENEGGDEAAAERAMMGMEAKSDIWAERVNLNMGPWVVLTHGEQIMGWFS